MMYGHPIVPTAVFILSFQASISCKIRYNNVISMDGFDMMADKLLPSSSSPRETLGGSSRGDQSESVKGHGHTRIANRKAFYESVMEEGRSLSAIMSNPSMEITLL